MQPRERFYRKVVMFIEGVVYNVYPLHGQPATSMLSTNGNLSAAMVTSVLLLPVVSGTLDAPHLLISSSCR